MKTSDKDILHKAISSQENLETSFDSFNAWEKIEPQLKVQKVTKLIAVKALLKWSVAACIVLLLGSGFLRYYNGNHNHYSFEDLDMNLHHQEPVVSRDGNVSLLKDSLLNINAKANEESKNWIKHILPVSEDVKMIKVEVPYGNQKLLVLSDSSRVRLNAGSVLTFPEKFTANKRSVFLNGEAFFEVRHNPERPFIVNTHHEKIKVLGTTFNLQAFTDDQNVEVALLEGKVSVQQKKGRVVLNPGQAYRRLGEDTKVVPFELKDISAWLDGAINFNNESLGDKQRELERRFGVRLIFEDSAIKNLPLTTIFHTNSLEELLDYVQVLQSFEYSREGNSIRLY